MLRLHLKRYLKSLTLKKRYVAKRPLKANNHQLQQQYYLKNYVNKPSITLFLLLNQKFNQRIIFNLELYHKNILLKSPQTQKTFYKNSKRQYLLNIKIS